MLELERKSKRRPRQARSTGHQRTCHLWLKGDTQPSTCQAMPAHIVGKRDRCRCTSTPVPARACSSVTAFGNCTFWEECASWKPFEEALLSALAKFNSTFQGNNLLFNASTSTTIKVVQLLDVPVPFLSSLCPLFELRVSTEKDRGLAIMAVSADDKAKAVALKNQGNEAFKKHDWQTAVEFYTKAIELDDTDPTYYANRAQVGPPQSRILTALLLA